MELNQQQPEVGIQNVEATVSSSSSTGTLADTINHLPVALLLPHPHNPRGTVDPSSVQELAESIKEKGIIEPLIVVPNRDKGRRWQINNYTIVAGHRRHAAAVLAERQTVPCLVREMNDGEQEDLMLVENLQREDLTLFQEAKAFRRRLDEEPGLKQSDLARRLGLPEYRVGQRLQILQLPITVQRLFDGELPITAAPLLLAIENADRQLRLANMIANRTLTVPALKQMVQREKTAGKTGTNKLSKSDGRSAAAKAAKKANAYTRGSAMTDLEGVRNDTLTFGDVLASMDGVCNSCGMTQNPEICAACPLPQLINHLVNVQRYECNN